MIPISDITVLPDNNYKLAENSDFDIISCDSIPSSFIKSDSGDAGNQWSIKDDLVIDKVDSSVALKYSYQRYVVLVLSTTAGKEVVLGCQQYPVLALLTPNLQTDSLSLMLNTPVRPII